MNSGMVDKKWLTVNKHTKKSLESYYGQYFKDQMKPGSSEEDLMSTVSHDRLKKKTGS